jgi:hypothetical protein
MNSQTKQEQLRNREFSRRDKKLNNMITKKYKRIQSTPKIIFEDTNTLPD